MVGVRVVGLGGVGGDGWSGVGVVGSQEVVGSRGSRWWWSRGLWGSKGRGSGIGRSRRWGV